MATPFVKAVHAEVAQQLSDLGGRWKAKRDGVIGPRNLGVLVADTTCGPNCIELGFVWDRKDPEASITWDHVGCYGVSDAERAASGVGIWSQTTAPALLEVLAQDGRFAGHFHSDDEDGVPGWHAAHGPWLGWGADDDGLDAANELQAWALAHPPLPVLADAIVREVDCPGPIGVKILFASSGKEAIAEVRVDGTVSEPASQLLLELEWPRAASWACVRSFVVLIHEE